MQLPRIGDLFEHKYKIQQLLGQGGMASVYRAVDIDVGRDVAIKVLTPRSGEYPATLVARFMVEARVIASLQDPHTIRLFEFGEASNGLLYMVFQYVEGNDLATVLRLRGALPPDIAAHIVHQILQALMEAHKAGVLHRDLKPANVLIHPYMGDEFAAKLLDFGIAKVDRGEAPSLTKTGTLLGTPRYMAPEQIFGEAMGPATDIYSLGLVFYEMLVGEPAVPGDQKAILERHAAQQPHLVPVTIAWPALRSVLERMLALDPHRRYRSAGDALRALDDALQRRHESQPQPVKPSSNSSHSVIATTAVEQRPANRDVPRGVKIAWIVGCCAVLALGGFLAFGSNEPRPPSIDHIPSSLLTAPPAPPTVAADDITSRDAGAAPADVEIAALESASPVIPIDLPDGCGKDLPPPPDAKSRPRVSVTIGGGVRYARLYAPKNYDKNRRYPVVLALNFLNESVGTYVHAIEFGVTHRRDYFVIAPEPQTPLTRWGRTSRDREFVITAVRRAYQSACLDRTRIFGMGHYDGARLLRKLTCNVQFSGIQTTGYSDTESTCKPPYPLPWLRILGRQDPVAPPDGGYGCRNSYLHLSVDQQDARWFEQNSCAGPPQPYFQGKAGACRTWACETPYASCLVDGGHDLVDSPWRLLRAGCKAPLLEFEIGDVTRQFFDEQASIVMEVPAPGDKD